MHGASLGAVVVGVLDVVTVEVVVGAGVLTVVVPCVDAIDV